MGGGGRGASPAPWPGAPASWCSTAPGPCSWGCWGAAVPTGERQRGPPGSRGAPESCSGRNRWTWPAEEESKGVVSKEVGALPRWRVLPWGGLLLIPLPPQKNPSKSCKAFKPPSILWGSKVASLPRPHLNLGSCSPHRALFPIYWHLPISVKVGGTPCPYRAPWVLQLPSSSHSLCSQGAPPPSLLQIGEAKLPLPSLRPLRLPGPPRHLLQGPGNWESSSSSLPNPHPKRRSPRSGSLAQAASLLQSP